MSDRKEFTLEDKMAVQKSILKQSKTSIRAKLESFVLFPTDEHEDALKNCLKDYRFRWMLCSLHTADDGTN